jgi:hypothetical protein
VGPTTSADVGVEDPVGDPAGVLVSDADALAVGVAADVDDRAVGVDVSPPRVTNTVTATPITTRTRAPMPRRPHRGPFGGFGVTGGYGFGGYGPGGTGGTHAPGGGEPGAGGVLHRGSHWPACGGDIGGGGTGRGGVLIGGGEPCRGVFGTTVVASPSSAAGPRWVPGQSVVISASRSSSGVFIEFSLPYVEGMREAIWTTRTVRGDGLSTC